MADPRTCIVAEDEVILRHSLVAELRRAWPQLSVVAECEDGASAVEALAEHTPDVAFLDIRMPGLTGLEVAAVAADASPRTRIVFVTAYDQYAIDAFERMGPTLEQDTIEEAARETALAEDSLLFYGSRDHPGLLTSTDTPRVALSDWTIPGRVVTDLLSAVQKLDEAGVKGPYGAVMSPVHYYSYLRNTVEGYPAAKQVGLVVEEVHSSPVVDGAVVFSSRGGDFVITVGGDFSVGYRWHDESAVHLFCVETIAAQLLTPHALCLIRPD